MMSWLLSHFLGALFKIGRLQFNCETFKSDFHAFRHLKDENILRGHPVPPTGAAVAELHNYAAEEWEPILEKGDPVLGVHIPAAGKLDHGECGDSFKRALVFFPAHVPEYPFKAFHCDSWLLDNQFENILPDNSNIRKFLMEFYLYPVQGASSAQLFERVFNCKPRDADSLPINNSLQQALVAHLKQGGHFHNGGGIIFPRDMRWGTSTHR
jgi:hypothetical protein